MKMNKMLAIVLAILWLLSSFLMWIEAQAEPMRVKIVQARGGLRVRQAPTTKANSIYSLSDATTVVVIEELNGWYRVAFNSPPHAEIGWVCGAYLK